MLRFNHFILVLIVPTITTTIAEEKDSCNLIDETLKQMCKVLESFYHTHDNGQFSKVVCGCITSFLKSDPSHCKAKNYDFPVAPLCGKLYKSKDFEIAGSRSDNFLTEFTKVLFGNGLHVCNEKNEKKLFQAASTIFQPGTMSDFYILVFKNAFPAEISEQFTNCYKELLDLSPKLSED